LGILTDDNPLSPLQRYDGILVTLFPKIIVETFVSPPKATSLMLPAVLQLSALKNTVVNPVQYLNAELPIEVTELPMVTEVRPLQP